MPTETPKNFIIDIVSHIEIALSWQDIPILSTHGIMRNFTISCNATLANQSLHQRDAIVNVTQEDVERYSFNMTDLFPHTVYNCTVQGCTTPGCGPKAEQLSKTLEYCKLLF